MIDYEFRQSEYHRQRMIFFSDENNICIICTKWKGKKGPVLPYVEEFFCSCKQTQTVLGDFE